MKKETSNIAGRVERLQAVADRLLGRIGEELAGSEPPGDRRYKEIADTLKVIRDIQLMRTGEEESAPGKTVEIRIRGAEEEWGE